jgi:hypothetical protein
MVACNWLLLTAFVVRRAPFQSTVAPTKPVPFTVMVRALLPSPIEDWLSLRTGTKW